MSFHNTSPGAAPSASHVPAVSDQGLLRGALGLAIVCVLGFGVLYPLAGVGLGQALFPHPANGSLIERDGQVVGSSLVAQPFADDRYFQSRPSAAGFNAMALSGSNQARTNPDLRQRIEQARVAVAIREGVDPAAVPSDLVTQSGGGIDPHISPEAAAIQIERVARARGIDRKLVEGLVARHTEQPQFGLLGKHRVQVLALNLALDALADAHPQAPSVKP